MAELVTNREAHRLIRRYRTKCEGDVEEITGLNITAMMDMMTILLVFLLKTFAVSSGLIVPSEEDLRLPKSSVASPTSESLVVTLTRHAILVEGQTVVGLAEGKVHGIERKSGQSLEIKEIKEVLSMIGELNARKGTEDGKPYERRMLLVADRETPYSLIVSVVYSALLANFQKYQLVVVSTTAD